VFDDLDRTLAAILARVLEFDPELSSEAAVRRVAHLAGEAGLSGLTETLRRIAAGFGQLGIINPYRLMDDGIRPYFFLANGRPGLLSQVIRDSERAKDGISQYVVFGHWDSLLILQGSAEESSWLAERLRQGAYEETVSFTAKDVLLACRRRTDRKYEVMASVSAQDINEVALNYSDADKQLRESMLAANVMLGSTVTMDGRSPYPITAFVGILVRTRATISGVDILNILLRQEDLQRCLVDLYEVDHGVPFHYFAKIACATVDELDAATNAVAFASSGGVRFEGETLVVARGSEQPPLVRKADVASLLVVPDIGPIARRAQRVFENLDTKERSSFNALSDERQLATLRALVGLQSAIDNDVFDAQTRERIGSAISTFARESTKSDGAPNLTGAVIEVTSMVEILTKTFLSRLAYSVCGKDPARIQAELKLPTSKIRTLSLGKSAQALRIAAGSPVFASVHHRIPEEWIERLDNFAGERNSWAHGAAQGTEAQLVDQAFAAMREGIAIAGWLAAGLRSIMEDRELAGSRDNLELERADAAFLTLPPRASGSELSVFVSHAASDGPTAERLAMGLQAMGYNSWYAEWELRAGDSIVSKVQAALSASDVLIVVLSRQSVASNWVGRELNSILMSQLGGQRVLVIPVLIEKCEIPPLLSDTLHVDLHEDFEKGFLKILDAIRAHRNRVSR